MELYVDHLTMMRLSRKIGHSYHKVVSASHWQRLLSWQANP